MTQRTIHKAGAKSNGHGEQNAFERWLLRPLDGARRPRDGSEAQQKMIRQNLERAAEAPFSLRTRIKLMEEIFSTADQEKAISILKGLDAITDLTGSMLAYEAQRCLYSSYREAMDAQASGSVASPLKKSVSRSRDLGDGPYYVGYAPPRMCGYDGGAHADDVEDVFLG